MGLWGEYRSGRRDDRQLGRGVWRRAHDRFRRGLDRYHQVLETVSDPRLSPPAVALANELADLLPVVREICIEAHRRAPSQTQDIPASENGHLADAHRQLSRAGNAMAQTAEALTMARFTAPAEPDAAGVDPRMAGIRRRAESVSECVRTAADLLGPGGGRDGAGDSLSPDCPR